MPAYVLAVIHEITDPESYRTYVSRTPATLELFGGRFLARQPQPTTLEGPTPSRVALLEFPSEQHARDWYASPEYQAVLPLRQRASRATLLLLPAYEPLA